MILRNKKTGEHGDYSINTGGDLLEVRNYYDDDEVYQYDSIAKFYEQWEDYKPAEPLIKDKKIRKAVRAWAEADEVAKVYVYAIGGGEYSELYAQDKGVTDGRIRMSIKTQDGIDWGDEYTIEELCGDEEECES